jgi:hypothetical protein
MRGLRTSLRTGALALVLAGGALALTAGIASADVACNSYGECWHVKERPAVTLYPPQIGIQFYGDDWRKAHERDEHYHWMKDRDDRGYYSHGEWHAFSK